jgi:hypothetical protein
MRSIDLIIHHRPLYIKGFRHDLHHFARRLRLKTELYVIRWMVQTRQSILYNEINKMLKKSI